MHWGEIKIQKMIFLINASAKIYSKISANRIHTTLKNIAQEGFFFKIIF